MSSRVHSSERGAVIVMVAVWLPVLALFASFAIDFGHFFDYSRNLQNRADAAALAAGVEFQNCLGTPGTTQLGNIGHAAQQYAGPPNGTPDTPNLPYPFTTIPAGQYQNQPTAAVPGTGSNFFMVLNGKTSYNNGGRNFDDGNFCSADYTNPPSPAVDVWLTQEEIPLFFRLLPGLKAPDISAHARVSLQGEASSTSVPIAVGDTGFTPCVTVFFKNSNDNSLLGTAVLHEEPNSNPSATNPFVWDNAVVQLDANGNPIPNTGPTSVAIPTGANVYSQVFLNNCSGSGQLYDGDSTTGMLYINSHPATAPSVGTNDPPKLTCSTPANCGATGPGGAGGVFLTKGTCNPDSYFAAGADCKDIVNAYVKFDPGITKSKTQVSFIDHQWDPTANNGAGGFVASPPVQLTQSNTDPTDWFSNNNPQMLNVPASSGIHEIEITWEQTAGSVTGKGTCTNQSTNPCKDSFGIQAQAFGACNGCDQPDDSGPIILDQLRLSTDASNVFGENTLPAGTTQHLVVTLELGGLFAQKPGDQPPTILRFPTSGNHQTGLVDCGQGNSGNNDSQVVYYGCGPNNPLVPGMNPLFIYSRTDNSGCAPATDGDSTNWPSGNHQDCVQTTPGTRRQNIICPLVRRIVGAPFGTTCNGLSTTGCPTNHWDATNPPQAGDPRAIQMIITSPADLAAAGNSPQFWLPIRKFATFYITGWDKNISPQCPDNEAFPGKGKLKNEQNAAVWGHWMNYLDTSGTPNGQTCDLNSVSATNCVPALTR
jgi:putative Flp pilus-assembly TadE/G-like protein